MVDLDEDGVGDSLVDAFLQNFGIGDKQIITHQLHFFVQAIAEVFPSVPVALGHAVFDAENGVLVHPSGQHIGPLTGIEDQAFTCQMVFTVFVKLAGGAVEAQNNLLTRSEASLVDGVQDHLNRRFMARHIGGKTTLVTHGNAHAFVAHDFFQSMKDFRAIAQGFAKIRRPYGDDHQLLQIEVVVSVGAAIDHVHHGNRHLHTAHAAEIAVQGQTRFFGRRTGHRHGHGQNGIGTEAGFVVCAVKLDQGVVQKRLFAGIQANHSLCDLVVDILHSLQDTFAAVACGVAVAQFDGFTAAGGCTRGNGGTTHDAAFQQDIALHRGVATAVQNFTSNDVDDCTHVLTFFERRIRLSKPMG